jgi:D-glycero-alpha-D-manno-heptose 1-phosphate guanylyltransferase
MQIVVLCGGLGTRLRSVVADRPKSLAPVAGKPFLEHILAYYRRLGATRFLLATGYLSEQIEALFPDGHFQGAEVVFSREEDPLGTGGALRHAGALLAPDFFVVNGDTWMECDLAALRALGLARDFSAVLALREIDEVSRYGAVRLDSENRIREFVEKGAHHGPGTINAGVYWLRRSLVETMPAGKVSLESHTFPALLDGRLGGLPAAEGRFIDIGIPADFARAQNLLADLNH